MFKFIILRPLRASPISLTSPFGPEWCFGWNGVSILCRINKLVPSAGFCSDETPPQSARLNLQHAFKTTFWIRTTVNWDTSRITFYSVRRCSKANSIFWTFMRATRIFLWLRTLNLDWKRYASNFWCVFRWRTVFYSLLSAFELGQKIVRFHNWEANSSRNNRLRFRCQGYANIYFFCCTLVSKKLGKFEREKKVGNFTTQNRNQKAHGNNQWSGSRESDDLCLKLGSICLREEKIAGDCI